MGFPVQGISRNEDRNRFGENLLGSNIRSRNRSRVIFSHRGRLGGLGMKICWSIDELEFFWSIDVNNHEV